MARSKPQPVSYETDIFGEGVAVDPKGADRPRTSQAHGRHAADAIIAATSTSQPATRTR
jgi:hypothetical protein